MDQNKFVSFVNIVSPLDLLKMTINGFQDVQSAVNLVDTLQSCNTKMSVITQPISKTGGSNRICRFAEFPWLLM